MMTTLPQTLAEAEALDQADAVGRPQAFALPVGVTYLVGHSLGPASHSALARVQETAARDWAQGLVRSWNSAGWMDLAAVAGGRIAALIGAQSSEVIVTDSVSVNLFKLGAAALSLVRTREIAVEADEFPTDVYVAESLGRQVGAPVRLLEAGQGFHALEQGCVLIKSVANYRTAALADMAAYEAGALAGGGVITRSLIAAARAKANSPRANVFAPSALGSTPSKATRLASSAANDRMGGVPQAKRAAPGRGS